MRHNILGQLSLSNLPEENRLPADWGPRMRYPLLRFTISPLFEGQLVSVLQFYTLQTDRRLCLVLENIAGDGQAEVTVPAGSPVGFVTQAGVAEVLEDETAKAEKWQQLHSFKLWTPKYKVAVTLRQIFSFTALLALEGL